MYHQAYNSHPNGDSRRSDTNSVPPYPARSDHLFATPPQFQPVENSIDSTISLPDSNASAYVPYRADIPVSPWQFTVSPPPTELEQGSHNHRGDTILLSNLRHARTHRASRSTSDLQREARKERNDISTQASGRSRSRDGAIQTANLPPNPTLSKHLQAALLLQEDGFARIAQNVDSNDVRRTQSNRESQQSPRFRHFHGIQEAEQIMRDEELAKQISIADLGAAFRNSGQTEISNLIDITTVSTSDISESRNADYDTQPRYGAPPITHETEVAPSIPRPPQNVREYRTNESRFDEGSIDKFSGSPYDPQTSHTEDDLQDPAPYVHPAPEMTTVNSREPILSQASPALTRNYSQLPRDRYGSPPQVPSKAIEEDPSEHWSINKSKTTPIKAVPNENFAICDPCGREQPSVAYCSNCGARFCRMHWAEQWVHQGKTEQRLKDGVPHEKTDPWLAKNIELIIEPSLSQEEQNRLHQADDDTTWFGVIPDKAGKLMFHDFGRYEYTSLQSRFQEKSSQFPSLISFVGTTGAGKSTLIKGLVKLTSLGDNEKPQTPIVGLVQNQHVPTSGEVHLYWDPSTFNTNRPLLYADCEGLGGGSREPMAARATALRDRREHHRRKSQSDNIGLYVPYSNDGRTRSSSNPRSRLSYSSMSPSNTPMPSISPGPQASSDYPSSTRMPSYSPHSSQLEDTGWNSINNKTYRGTTREVLWANDKEKRSRQFIVENLYPRLLYTFSDIVVLVMRNAKEIETAVERLIRWAAAALEKSSNQPMLPFGIIVMNAVDNRTDPALWNVNTATNFLFKSIEDAVNKNPIFERWAWDWRDKDKRISTTEDLLRIYYTSVRIVYIPHKGRPSLVWKQYRKLYEEIQAAVAGSERQRRNARLLLSSDQFYPYLQFAFDHFSKTLDDPFDFVTASSVSDLGQRNVNPIFSLIKDYRQAWPDIAITTLFTNVTPLIASTIMIDVTRKRIQGTTHAIFPAYQKKIGQALKAFLDGHWPCEAKHPKTGERCVNVKTRHTKGHQTQNGKIFADKLFSNSPYLFQDGRDLCLVFEKSVYEKLGNLFKALGMKVSRKGLQGVQFEPQIAFKLHQEEIIQKQCSFLQGNDGLISNIVCFCCLFEFPIHSLLCGHTVCDACINAYGRPVRENVLSIGSCPICGISRNSGRSRVEVVRKPDNAGIRVLTLDGGGIRALIQLVILQVVETRIGFDIPIQEFFDLIVGTSGGGIVALALGEKNMRLPDATKMFKDFSKRAFHVRRGGDFPLLGTFIRVRHHSRYETRGIEEVLKESFGTELLFGGPRQFQSPSRCKVAVTTTDTNEHAKLLANYNRMTRLHTPYEFQRFEKARHELSIWEAARATSAAPGYFKAFYCSKNGHTYEDGALKLNNPVLAADYERQVIWPERAHLSPDVLVSIGTGYFPDVKTKSSDPGPAIGIGLVDGVKAFINIAKGFGENQLDCERTWNEYMQCTFSDQPEMQNRFHRLSLKINGSKIDLDAVDQLDKLEHLTKQQFHNKSRGISDVAGQLIASLFYFEVITRVGPRITGIIRCRLPKDSHTEGSLQKLARGLGRMHPSTRFFRIYPDSTSNHWLPAEIDDRMLLNVEKQDKSFGVETTFDFNDQCAACMIYLCLPNFLPQAISGFPMSLREHRSSVVSSPVLSRESSFV